MHSKSFIKIIGILLLRFQENCPREKLPPSPNYNANPKPNPDPDRGGGVAIFLGDDFPDTVINSQVC